jgi:hypothetical protein
MVLVLDDEKKEGGRSRPKLVGYSPRPCRIRTGLRDSTVVACTPTGVAGGGSDYTRTLLYRSAHAYTRGR